MDSNLRRLERIYKQTRTIEDHLRYLCERNRQKVVDLPPPILIDEFKGDLPVLLPEHRAIIEQDNWNHLDFYGYEKDIDGDYVFQDIIWTHHLPGEIEVHTNAMEGYASHDDLKSPFDIRRYSMFIRVPRAVMIKQKTFFDATCQKTFDDYCRDENIDLMVLLEQLYDLSAGIYEHVSSFEPFSPHARAFLGLLHDNVARYLRKEKPILDLPEFIRDEEDELLELQKRLF